VTAQAPLPPTRGKQRKPGKRLVLVS